MGKNHLPHQPCLIKTRIFTLLANAGKKTQLFSKLAFRSIKIANSICFTVVMQATVTLGEGGGGKGSLEEGGKGSLERERVTQGRCVSRGMNYGRHK